jgi:hypothetical protein
MRVALTESEFHTLVSGGVVKRETNYESGFHNESVEIILSDIGFDVMERCIRIARYAAGQPRWSM